MMRRWREQGRSVLFISHRLAEVARHLRPGHGAARRRRRRRAGAARGRRGAHRRADARRQARDRAPRRSAAARRRRGRRGRPGPSRAALEVARPRASAARSTTSRFALRAGEIARRRRARGPGPGRALRLPRRRSAGPTAARSSSTASRSAARTPYDAIRAGVVLVPGRPDDGAAAAALGAREHRRAAVQPRRRSWGPINMRRRARRVGDAIDRLQIDTRAQRQVRRLSGGNQQKVTIAPLARRRLPGDALLRPDARHRRRHQAPDLRAAARAGRGGRRGAALHQRAAARSRWSATARSCSTSGAVTAGCPPRRRRRGARCCTRRHGLVGGGAA